MKKFKKLFIIIFAFFMLVPVLSGCEIGRVANDTGNFTIIVTAPTRYTLNVVNGNGSNTCEENTEVTVTSTHNNFGYWYTTDINEPVSFQASYTFVLIEDTIITAVDSFVGMSFAMFDTDTNAEIALQGVINVVALNDIATYAGYVVNSICTGGSEGYSLQEGTHIVVNATTINLVSTIYANSGYLVAWKRIEIGNNYSTLLFGEVEYINGLTPTFNYVCQDNITYYFTFNLVNSI